MISKKGLLVTLREGDEDSLRVGPHHKKKVPEIDDFFSLAPYELKNDEDSLEVGRNRSHSKAYFLFLSSKNRPPLPRPHQ